MGNVKTRIAKYGRVPKGLLHDAEISCNSKVIYGLIDDVGGSREITVAMLASWTGQSERTVQRNLRELVDTGWLEIGYNRDKRSFPLPSTYTLNDRAFSKGPVNSDDD